MEVLSPGMRVPIGARADRIDSGFTAAATFFGTGASQPAVQAGAAV